MLVSARLASLVWLRTAEITDALVDLLIAVVAKLNTHADRRVEREMTEDLRRVRGEEGLLFRLAGDSYARLYPSIGRPTSAVCLAIVTVVVALFRRQMITIV